MKRTFLYYSLILSIFGICCAGEAQRKVQTSVEAILKVADQIISTQELQVKVKPILQESIHFPSMTKRSVGPGWKQFSETQQHEAVILFCDLVVRSYCNKFTPGEKAEIEFKKEVAVAEGRQEVVTKLVYAKNRYEVIYRVEQIEGAWWVTDVIIEGVSLVANYRSQLDAAFQQGGASAVIQAMKNSIKNK
jgi:phospholipid transport system substrate-binding protein